jgi:hypothetical protein
MLTIVQGGSAYGARLITTEPISRGHLAHRITHTRLRPRPTYQTIQVGREAHIEDLGVIVYLNHSCQPNVVVNTTEMTITALRDIAAGEELTFFYPSTEWEMERPFVCLCGAPQCVRLVAGAKYLSIDTLSRYFINQHIRDLILETLAGAHTARAFIEAR